MDEIIRLFDTNAIVTYILEMGKVGLTQSLSSIMNFEAHRLSVSDYLLLSYQIFPMLILNKIILLKKDYNCNVVFYFLFGFQPAVLAYLTEKGDADFGITRELNCVLHELEQKINPNGFICEEVRLRQKMLLVRLIFVPHGQH